MKQVALADRLLITKTDLAAADTIAQLDRLLISLNPGAARHVVSNGEIAPDALFGAALFDPSRRPPNPPLDQRARLPGASAWQWA